MASAKAPRSAVASILATLHQIRRVSTDSEPHGFVTHSFARLPCPGNTCKLNDSQRQALVNIVERGPMPAIHGVVRWRLKDLTLWIWEEFQISLSETTLSRELRGLGYRKLSARPRHYAQNPEALELFKKVSPPP